MLSSICLPSDLVDVSESPCQMSSLAHTLPTDWPELRSSLGTQHLALQHPSLLVNLIFSPRMAELHSRPRKLCPCQGFKTRTVMLCIAIHKWARQLWLLNEEFLVEFKTSVKLCSKIWDHRAGIYKTFRISFWVSTDLGTFLRQRKMITSKHDYQNPGRQAFWMVFPYVHRNLCLLPVDVTTEYKGNKRFINLSKGLWTWRVISEEWQLTNSEIIRSIEHNRSH